MSRISTFGEFNLDYLCEGENIFNFGLPEAFPVLFSKAQLKEEINMVEDIALKLASVLPAIKDYHNV